MSIRVILFGTSAFGVPSFQRLHDSTEFDIVHVVSQPARPVGRHQDLTPTPVTAWALSQSLPVSTPVSLKTPEIENQLRSMQAELYLVAAYGLIVPQTILDIPKYHCINIHASLLPRHRGASPIAAAIATGDSETGITFMRMDAGCDTGPILQAHRLTIFEQEARPELEQRLSELASEHIVSLCTKWAAGEIPQITQPSLGSTVAPKLSRDDGHAVWDSAEHVLRRLRAYTPWPGCWTTWNMTQIKIISAAYTQQTFDVSPGTIVEHDGGWAIACRQGCVIPTVVQFAGKKAQPAKQVLGSYPHFLGSVLV